VGSAGGGAAGSVDGGAAGSGGGEPGVLGGGVLGLAGAVCADAPNDHVSAANATPQAAPRTVPVTIVFMRTV
jgi:hypothetical protein